jgi:tripartite-type tricarboxylate transporter receptor subunit TctC
VFKKIATLAISLVIGLGAFHARAETVDLSEFKNKTLTIVVGYGPGSISDIMARAAAKAVTEQTGINTVVVNKAGAFGTIGANFVADSTDGLTVCLCDGSNVYTNKLLNVPNSVDIGRLKIVTAISNGYTVLVAPSGAPYNTVQELVAHIKQNPQKAIYANSGTVMALQARNFLRRAGIQENIEAITLRGDPDLQQILLRGDVLFGLLSVTSSKTLGDAGKLKILAIDFDTRRDTFSKTPTLTEIYGPSALTSFHGMYVSDKVSDETRKKLNTVFVNAFKSPELQTLLEKLDRQILRYDIPNSEKFFKTQLDYTTNLINTQGRDLILQ